MLVAVRMAGVVVPAAAPVAREMALVIMGAALPAGRRVLMPVPVASGRMPVAVPVTAVEAPGNGRIDTKVSLDIYIRAMISCYLGWSGRTRRMRHWRWERGWR